MKDVVTVRIYFKYGQKINNQSFWKKMYASDFSTELIKRAKAFGLEHVLHLNVSKGYMDNQNVNWGENEIRHAKHPHLIEIMDSEIKINQFIDEQKELLRDTKVLIVKNEVLVR